MWRSLLLQYYLNSYSQKKRQIQLWKLQQEVLLKIDYCNLEKQIFQLNTKKNHSQIQHLIMTILR